MLPQLGYGLPRDHSSSLWPYTDVLTDILPPHGPAPLFPQLFFLPWQFTLPPLGSGLPTAICPPLTRIQPPRGHSSSQQPCTIIPMAVLLPATIFSPAVIHPPHGHARSLSSCRHLPFFSPPVGVLSLSAVGTHIPALPSHHPFRCLKPSLHGGSAILHPSILAPQSLTGSGRCDRGSEDEGELHIGNAVGGGDAAMVKKGVGADEGGKVLGRVIAKVREVEKEEAVAGGTKRASREKSGPVSQRARKAIMRDLRVTTQLLVREGRRERV